MYKVSLKDVGVDRVTKDWVLPVDTESEALILAEAECRKLLCRDGVLITTVGDGEYVATTTPVMLGSFTLEKL